MTPPEPNEHGERLAKVEAHLEHCRERADGAHARIDVLGERMDGQGRNLIDVASASGAASAKAWMEGLKESFIKDTAARLRKLERRVYAAYAVAGAFAVLASLFGVREWLS